MWTRNVFGARVPAEARLQEWRRLGIFFALGAAAFAAGILASAFVPFAWPDPVRRAAHATVFVPLILVITSRMLRRDAAVVPAAERFTPSPVARSSAAWLLMGVLQCCVVALVFLALFGLRWMSNRTFDPVASVATILWSIPLIAAAEETAFRGYAFWRLIRLFGFWPAQMIVAVLFAISHMTLGGYALLPALAGTIAGSLLYGVAFARQRGLAAPIALHIGWNITQHVLLSPLDPSATPLVLQAPHPQTSGEYVLALTVVALVLIAGMVALLRRAPRPLRAA
jgi:membrane protease YdiL (CAAX protease family)